MGMICVIYATERSCIRTEDVVTAGHKTCISGAEGSEVRLQWLEEKGRWGRSTAFSTSFSTKGRSKVEYGFQQGLNFSF